MNRFVTQKTTHLGARPSATSLASAAALLLMFVSRISFAVLDQTEVNSLINELGYSSATPVKQIRNFPVNDFKAVNGDSVVISAGPKQKYLITLTTRCHDIAFSQKIGFTSTLSQITKFDNIIVSNRGASGEVCPIQNIYKLEP